MARSNFTTTITGADKTAAAWSSVKNRARATGASIRSALKGAFMAAGAYMGFRSIVGTIKELGNLSDAAMRTGTSVDELTKSASAFSVIGLRGMNVEGLGRMFAYLEKNTGRTGLSGFYETIDEIQKLPTAAERGQAAVKYFGRSGMDLLPIINGGKEATTALKDVIAAMPGIPQSAAAAGDKAADGINILTGNIKSIWSQGVAFMCRAFDDQFAGGTRESALLFGAWLEMWVKRVANFIIDTFKQAGKQIGGHLAAITELVTVAWDKGSWTEGVEAARRVMDVMHEDISNDQKQFMERDRRFVEAFEKRKEEIAKFEDAYGKVDAALSNRKNRVTDFGDSPAAARLPQIRNALIAAGSNDALKIAALGPQVSETKKQTDILKKIAANTEKTAENTLSENSETLEVKVVD